MTMLRNTIRLGAGIGLLALLAGCAGGSFVPAQDSSGFATSSTSFAPNMLNHPDIAGGPPDLLSNTNN